MKRTNKNESSKKFSLFSPIKNSLQLQIIIPFIILIVVTGGVISFVSYQSSVDMTTEELTNNVEGQMQSMSDTFDIYFNNVENTLERLSSNKLVQDPMNHEQDVLTSFKETVEANSSITNLYTGLPTDDFIIYPEIEVGADFIVTEREWYLDGSMANGDVVWTEPYVDEVTGETVVSAAKAYYQGEQLIGVIAADVLVTNLIEIVNSVEIGETGFAVVFNESGQLIAHPEEEMVGKDESDQPYYQQMIDGDTSGIIEFESRGQDMIMGYAQNPLTGWVIGGTVQKDDFTDQARGIITPILITLGIVVVLAIAVSLLTTRRITRAIQMVMERMRSIADGNLNHEPLIARSDDEVGQLVHATNEMKENMRHVLQEINEVSEIVSGQSEELTQSAGEVRAGSEQVASTMQELASGAETQANSASNLSEAMQSFADQISEINDNSELIETSSNDMIQMTNEGSVLMDQSKEQMATIDEMVRNAVDNVQGLSTQTEEISQLVEVIQDIADQTNLLALNAAIEAARAGEHGQGFAVVADEVRNLAEQVAVSVTDITQIVSNIQSESRTVTDSLQAGYKEVESGTTQIEATGEKFNSINNALTEMVQNVNTAMTNLETITSRSEHINTSIEDIAAVSEEAAAGVQQTSASSQQTSAAMEEVSESSNQLARLAEQLSALVHRFRL